MNPKTMKTQIAAILALFGAVMSASAAESYQVTGPVVEVTESKIIVQKDKEKWEIARTADTKVTGTPKVGDKVTIHYTMAAASIEVKADKAAPAKPDTAAPAKPEKKKP